MSEGAGRPTTGGGQDFAGIRSRAGAQGASGGSDNTQTDFNEQSLTFKGLLDPSVETEAMPTSPVWYVMAVQPVWMQTPWLLRMHRRLCFSHVLEYFPDYSEENVENVRQSLEKTNS
jgi:hypothetical protein